MTRIMIILFVATVLSSYSKPTRVPEKAKLQLQFRNFFGQQPLDTGQTYTNAHGEPLKVTTLNYFISNIKLTMTDGTVFSVPQDSSYFLVKLEDPDSQTILLENLPQAKYKSISFLIGIDSTRNTLDVSKRTGSLDIAGKARGMYWAWNSGYIFLKFEGKSPVIPDSLSNNFYYHIGGFGGFKSPTINNIRARDLQFRKPLSLGKKTPVVDINFDVSTLFRQKTDIELTKNSNVMWGDLSVLISENYAPGFTLGNITR